MQDKTRYRDGVELKQVEDCINDYQIEKYGQEVELMNLR